MKPCIWRISVLVLCLSLTLARLASAQITQFFDPSPFGGTEAIASFNIPEFPPVFPEPLSSRDGLLLSLGSTGVGLVLDDRPRPFNPGTDTDDFAIDNDFAGCCLPIDITFPNTTTRVAFVASFNGNSVGATVDFYNGGTPVGTSTTIVAQSPGSPSDWVFTGFSSASSFNRIVVTGPVNGYVRIDDVRWDVAPPNPLVVSCVSGPNPGGNVPAANNEDGFFTVSVSGGSGSATLAFGSFSLGNGETIKITQTSGAGVRYVNSQQGVRHFQAGAGDQVVASDGSTIVSTSCDKK